MIVPLLLATAVAKKRKSLRVKKLIKANIIAKKAICVQKKVAVCVIAKKMKSSTASPIEKFTKARKKAMQLKKAYNTLEKSAKTYKKAKDACSDAKKLKQKLSKLKRVNCN
ncbi:hypothetical protein KORDIASMS9_03276 [Kordia sp. SMS9]|uniref:hypothetical protein n=1 Tax=Kordia sp. SMS9 TaxID=2282170 RepID=UPI000E0D2007|nr:hypothetical protein [Kordia sp. SMS9]AXG71021.1 hypothetical protein KORDIASMS9_03276 [Kordia sp. SMS9]